MNRNHTKILALIGVAWLASVAHAQTAREIAQQSSPSVVLIVAEGKNGKSFTLGTGFFIADDVVATNSHVIRGGLRLYAKLRGEEGLQPFDSVIADDSQKDLALLRLRPAKETMLNQAAGKWRAMQDPIPPFSEFVRGLGKRSHLSIGDQDEIGVGDQIYVVGNPEGLEGTFSQGNISGIRRMKGIGYLQISAPVSHGSSGGPVLNKSGGVIGVVVGSFVKGQNLNFAVPVSYLLEMAAAARVKLTYRVGGDDWEAVEEGDSKSRVDQSTIDKRVESILSDSRAGTKLPANQPPISAQPSVPAESVIDRVNRYMSNKMYDEALVELKAALKSDEFNPKLRAWLGLVLLQKDLADEAIAQLEVARSLAPGSWQPLEMLGDANFSAWVIKRNLSFRIAACRMFEQALALGSSDSDRDRILPQPFDPDRLKGKISQLEEPFGLWLDENGQTYRMSRTDRGWKLALVDHKTDGLMAYSSSGYARPTQLMGEGYITLGGEGDITPGAGQGHYGSCTYILSTEIRLSAHGTAIKLSGRVKSGLSVSASKPEREACKAATKFFGSTAGFGASMVRVQ
jgi:S1-C subfamily serine protease